MPALASLARHEAGEVDVRAIRMRLAKRAHFEAAAAELTSALLRRARCRQLDPANAQRHEDADMWDAVERAFTLLRSRYTAPAFWRAGQMLFQAAIAAAATSAQRQAAENYLSVAVSHLEEAEAPAPAAQPAGATTRSFLFEGQMSREDDAPPRQPNMQGLLGMLVNGGTGEATAAETPADGPETQLAGTAQEQRAQALEQLLANFRDAFGDDNAGGLEEALRASLEEEGALHGPPPAAKAAVKALVRERLTAERLEQLGGAGVQCSVCREELVAGVEIQLMPCNDHHVYHPACLAPWLQEHNSCPVCRHELPTDDQKYETRKQRAAAQAEELRGARSALTHNEFMYT